MCSPMDGLHLTCHKPSTEPTDGWHHGDSQEVALPVILHDEISVRRCGMFYQNDDGDYRSKINFNVGQFRGSIKSIPICVGNFHRSLVCAPPPHDESRVITQAQTARAESPDITSLRVLSFSQLLGLTGTIASTRTPTLLACMRATVNNFGLRLITRQNTIFGKPAGPGFSATRNSHLMTLSVTIS